jgi:hypothetical protein
MPSITHDGMLQPFEHRPELAAELLAGALTVALPAWRHARLGSGDLSDSKAKAVLRVVIEVQLGKHTRKRYTWPAYVATLRGRQALGVLHTVDRDRAEVYRDAVRAAHRAAQDYLEEFVNTKGWVFRSDFAIRHRRETKAEAVLAVLDTRGIEVPDEARERIHQCTDLKKLDRWVRRAAKADSINDVFAK